MSVQLAARGDLLVLQLLKLLQSGIDRIAKMTRGGRTASQVASHQEFGLGSIGAGNQNTGGQLDLNGAIHHAESRGCIKIDEFGSAGVNVGWDSLGVSSVAQSNLQSFMVNGMAKVKG
jgi:hypothetical protein